MTNLVLSGVLGCSLLCPLAAQQSSGEQGVSPHPAQGEPAAISDRPADRAPRPPKISCTGNTLSIVADNATVSSILAGIQACTGVRIEIPRGATEERAFVSLGPAPARQAVAALLDSLGYNYVVDAADGDPQRIQSILLVPRQTENAAEEPPAAGPMTPARRAWMEARQRARPQPQNPDNAEAEPQPDPATEVTLADGGSAAVSSNAKTGASSLTESALSAAASTVESAGTAGAQIGLAAASDGSTATPSDPAGAPATSTTPPPERSDLLQQRITGMQQMFQQRQTLNQPAPPSPPQ